MPDQDDAAVVDSTITFLRMAVVEMRRIAADVPEVADRLGVIADKTEAEIEDLTAHFRLTRDR